MLGVHLKVANEYAMIGSAEIYRPDRLRLTLDRDTDLPA